MRFQKHSCVQWLLLGTVSVFYCHHNKLAQVIYNNPYWLSHNSVGQKLRASKDWNKVLCGWALIRRFWEESALGLIPGSGRIHLFSLVELRSLFSCHRSGKDLSLLLQAICTPFHAFPWALDPTLAKAGQTVPTVGISLASFSSTSCLSLLR